MKSECLDLFYVHKCCCKEVSARNCPVKMKQMLYAINYVRLRLKKHCVEIGILGIEDTQMCKRNTTVVKM